MQYAGMQYAPMAPAPQDLSHNDAPPMANNGIGVPDQHAFIAQSAGAINRDAVRVAQQACSLDGHVLAYESMPAEELGIARLALEEVRSDLAALMG
jgi:hypothetical protein